MNMQKRVYFINLKSRFPLALPVVAKTLYKPVRNQGFEPCTRKQYLRAMTIQRDQAKQSN
jgi:hypothetical protein